MAIDFRVVIPSDMGDTIKLGAKTPNKYDVDVTQLNLPASLTGLSLTGTVLKATTSEGEKTVDLAPMLPTIAAEIFLKDVQRQANKILFTVGEKNSAADDTILEVDVADLLPVVTDNTTITGTGVTTNPLKVQLSTAKTDNLLKQGADGLYVSEADIPVAETNARTVRLTNASGETVVGYIYDTEQ